MNIKADVIIDKQVTDISAVPSIAVVPGSGISACQTAWMHGEICESLSSITCKQ